MSCTEMLRISDREVKAAVMLIPVSLVKINSSGGRWDTKLIPTQLRLTVTYKVKIIVIKKKKIWTNNAEAKSIPVLP